MSTIKQLSAEELESIQVLKAAVKNRFDYQVGQYEYKPEKTEIYVWQKDGIYCVQQTNLATFAMKMLSGKFDGLSQTLKEGITLKVPKMPTSIFDDIWNFFKFIYHKAKTEVYVRVYYSPSLNNFYFKIPTQIVAGAKADWEIGENENLENNPEDILVMQAHSHHTMGGKFSSTDDKDHQTLEGVHMVIGSIFNTNPDVQIRFSYGDKKVLLDPEEVFQMEASSALDLSKFAGWDTNIRIRTYEPSFLPDSKSTPAKTTNKATDKKVKKEKKESRRHNESLGSRLDEGCEVIKVTPVTYNNRSFDFGSQTELTREKLAQQELEMEEELMRSQSELSYAQQEELLVQQEMFHPFSEQQNRYYAEHPVSNIDFSTY